MKTRLTPKLALRPKILPVLIVVATMALPFKIGAPWLTGGESHEALAQEKTGTEETSEAPSEAAVPTSAEVMAADLNADDSIDSSESEMQSARVPLPEGEGGETSDPQRTSVPANPFEMTDQEIELLQSLAARREALDQREGDIERRESVLAAAEARIEEKIAQLESLKSEIETLLAEQDKRQNEKIASLARIYAAMKPKEAARIFESLDMKVVLDVVDTMKERTSAAILAKMNPERAQAITLQLAQRDRLPGNDR